jgi:O-antigen ligase
VQPKTNLEWDYKLRWPLEKSLAPGEEIAMDVPVQTPPQDGEYLLTWDLVQEGIVWFGTKNGTLTHSQVKVGDVTESQATTNNMSLVQARPIIPPIPGRVTLWRIAGNYFTEHPLLGIGLDNFRLIYGRELDYTDWNTSIHTNSWYVATLVSGGFIGAVPFFAWLGLMVLRFFRTLRRPTLTIWQTAVAAGILTFLVHGILDYFLLFNTTALLFWLLLGFWFSIEAMGADS